ncbi:MAG: dTDP-4-amino-4,6-dideoxygalactose transaminase [Cyanobacteria bacterium J06554_6]
MQPSKISFSQPFIAGRELSYLQQALNAGALSGNGPLTEKCQQWLKQQIGCHQALLTHSCTAALEMAAILLDIQPGDEILMPSYTFVSTANAFVLRGGIPVFVDIRPDTLNLDETQLQQAITPRTKAIVPVHYAGVACEMEAILEIATHHRLSVVEDAAQGVMSTYHGQPVGSFGHLAALSFHSTKNVVSGEGGALLINHPQFIDRARIIWEKGTNRFQFYEGRVDKYTWVDVGSSFLPSELTAACLLGQLEIAERITDARLQIWHRYQAAFSDLEAAGWVRRPTIPADCQHNAHLYYLIVPDTQHRDQLIAALEQAYIKAVFHYVPLHSSPAGQKYGRAPFPMEVTDNLADRLLRLPLHPSLTLADADRVISTVMQYFEHQTFPTHRIANNRTAS